MGRKKREEMIESFPLQNTDQIRKERQSFPINLNNGIPSPGKMTEEKSSILELSVEHLQWKTYSGPRIEGTIPYVLPEKNTHFQRASWLTFQVESGGKFGAVIGYDGAGLTAGISQCISVYPSELVQEDNNPLDDQGPLWKLLNFARDRLGKRAEEVLSPISTKLYNAGWELREDGVLVKGADLKVVPGKEIRTELTPTEGRVPKTGKLWEHSKGWATAFHQVFANPETFASQVEFAIKHTQSVCRRRPKVLKGGTLASLIYDGGIEDPGSFFNLNDELDFAMAYWHSNSVNAPAIAFKRLKTAHNVFVKRYGNLPRWHMQVDRKAFALLLIRLLGNSSFGRWNSSLPSGRYQRTRSSAKELWPTHFFEGRGCIMPSLL